MKLNELLRTSSLFESDDKRKKLVSKRDELKSMITDIETEWASLDASDKHGQAEFSKIKREKQLRDKLARVRRELDKIFDATPV